MKEVALHKALDITKRLLKNNLEETEYTQNQQKAIMEYAGTILWFTLEHQGLKLVKSEDYYKAEDLQESLKNFLKENDG